MFLGKIRRTIQGLNPAQIRWIERLALLVLVGVYLGVTVSKIEYPGLYASEITHAPAALGLPHAPALVKWGDLPVLVMAYYGAIKVYVAWVVFNIFGVSVMAIRLPWILVTAAGLVALYYGLRKFTNRTIAMLAVILLVVDPTLTSQTKLDSGPVALEFFVKASVLGLWASVLKTKKFILLLLIWVLLAIGEYNKLNFLWFVNSFYASVVLLYWRTLLGWWRAGSKKVRLGLVAFGAGYLALAGYFVLIQKAFKILGYSDKPFNLSERLEIIYNQFVDHVSGTIFYNFALGGLDKPWLPWFFWTVMSVTAVGLVALFANAQLRRRFGRPTLFIVLIVVSTIAQIIATKSAKAPWHLFAIIPFFTILTSVAVYALAAVFKRLWQRAVLVGLVLAGLAASVTLQVRYLDAYDDPSQNIRWSAAIYDVLEFTKQQDATVVCVDWGTYTPLAVLDPVPGKYLNNVWYFRRESPERFAETAKKYFDPAKNYLFVLQDGERAYFKDAQDNFYASLKASGYELEPLLSVGSGEVPDFTVYKTK